MPNYTYPGSLTVKNKLGAETDENIEDRESGLVAWRAWEMLAGKGPQGPFDAERLKATHQYLFQDVYEWAGHTRDERVPLSDGTIATEPKLRKVGGTEFMPGAEIGSALEQITKTLKDENFLKALSREDFAERAADLLADINRIHAFREGNGRAQRVFVSDLAREAGHTLDFSVVSKERMIQASIAANERDDPSMMRRLFNEISDPDRVAALRVAVDSMNKQNFDWQDWYFGTTEPGMNVEMVMVGTAGDNFLAHADRKLLVGNVEDLPEPRPEREQKFVLDTRDLAQIEADHERVMRACEEAPAPSPEEQAKTRGRTR